MNDELAVCCGGWRRAGETEGARRMPAAVPARLGARNAEPRARRQDDSVALLGRIKGVKEGDGERP